jgi:hypothetical protein
MHVPTTAGKSGPHVEPLMPTSETQAPLGGKAAKLLEEVLFRVLKTYIRQVLLRIKDV